MKNHAFRNVPVMTIVFPVLLTVTGCGSHPDGTNEQPSTEGASQVIFEESYSATGRLRIIRFATGKLAVSVIGAIGKDDPKQIERSLSPSVVETYRALRPDQPVVPEILTALDERLRSVPKVDRPKRSAPTVSASQNASPNDPADFWATVCRTFYSGVCGTPTDCEYMTDYYGFCISDTYWPEDYSFFWNNANASGAGHYLQPFPGETVIYVPGNSWGYNRWEDYYGSPCILLNAGTGGTGLTIHEPTCD